MRQTWQSGAALAVSLIMLALLTLVGVAAIGAGLTNFKLVGNLQAQKEAEMALQSMGETYFSSAAPFTGAAGTCDPPAQTLTVNGLAVRVDIDEPRCISASQPPGETLIGKVSTLNTVWEIRATVRDTISGAGIAMRWGIAIPLLSTCPTAPTATACP